MASSTDFSILAVGFIAAFLAGLVACTWMISLVKKSKLSWFAIYCFVVGLAAILLHMHNKEFTLEKFKAGQVLLFAPTGRGGFHSASRRFVVPYPAGCTCDAPT